MEWLHWWENPTKQKETPKKWRVKELPDLKSNSSLKERLQNRDDESSGADSSSTARRRRTIREIRSYVEENREQAAAAAAAMAKSMSSEDFGTRRRRYKVAYENLSSSEDSGIASSYGESYETESGSDDSPEEDEEIDYELVEQYDLAFNEFIGRHPYFVVVNPDVVHSLRVCKLQKLLERGSNAEAELSEQLDMIESAKGRMEVHYQRELKESSRKKAALEIRLANRLSVTQKTTESMEAKLVWKLVSFCEANAKKHHRTRAKLRSKARFTPSRQGLLRLDFQSIRDAMLAPPSFMNNQAKDEEPLSEVQQTDLRQFQIDNAILHSQVAMLRHKLEQAKARAKANAWVESMLERMDPKVLKKLKSKVEKNKGITLS